ncbi:MAG: hypothetical protein WKG32_12200 [Gemmatimonadaceae bacterium]
MIARLAVRNLVYQPWRSALLLLGYGLGVGVMIVLLAIGEALLSQARDEKLVGGGSITVLPEGLDVEVMKTGGVGGLYFSIDQARFVYRQLLAAPRFADVVAAAAPQVEGKLLYLRPARAGGAEYAVRATGEIPSRTAGVGAAAPLALGAWTDDDGDRAWMTPSPRELYGEVDHFHHTPTDVENRESWGEWHYFNVLSHDHRRWAFISFILGGDVPNGRWGAQVLVSVREQGGRTRKFSTIAEPRDIAFSTTSPDLAVGDSRVTLLDDGRYAVRARTREEGGSAELTLDLIVTPAPRAYFPGAALASGAFTSGYAVAALRADATGTLCVSGRCERYDGAQAYHDHNWGVWRGVTWEWGAARAGALTILYGRVQPPDSLASVPPFFLFVVDSLGFRAHFRPREIRYDDARTIVVGGRAVRVPARAVMAAVRGDDTLRLELDVEDAIGTDTRVTGDVGTVKADERGDQSAARALARPYFIQMKGIARVRGRIGGAVVAGEGTGFFETYR